jgi:hypothetical protein
VHLGVPGLALPLLGVLLGCLGVVVVPLLGRPALLRILLVVLVRLVPSCERREHLDRAAVGQPYRLMSAGAHGVTVDEERASPQDAHQFTGVSLARRVQRLGERGRVEGLLGDPGRGLRGGPVAHRDLWHPLPQSIGGVRGQASRPL